jgi:hypothetical protein
VDEVVFVEVDEEVLVLLEVVALELDDVDVVDV